MLYYFASNVNQNIISEAIRETDQVVVGSECNQELNLLEYVKDNYAAFGSVDKVIVDIAGVKDSDDSILEALNMLRICNDQTQIIVIASNRLAGDELLAKCFAMSIYDIITTDDFNDLKDEIIASLTDARQYKDSIRYRDVVNQAAKTEMKKVVSNITIGLAGSMPRIGVTHHSIILANHLKKKGYRIAVLEMNDSNAFNDIADSFDLQIRGDHFVKEGIAYYPSADADTFLSVNTKAYNFILIDFGQYTECDFELYQHCNYKLIFSGVKAWEDAYIQPVFDHGLKAGADLSEYNYYFNFVEDSVKGEVKIGMGELEKVYFCESVADPFHCCTFPGADEMLKDYMPVHIDTKGKKGKR